MEPRTDKLARDKERISWLDVLKLIGILEVFIGHFYDAAGRLYPYVFTHHVALFFFASGCAEAMDSETRFSGYLLKKARGLLIPYFVFGLLSIGTVALVNDCGFAEALSPLLGLAVGGIRNRFYMGLWFITGLFTASLAFWFLKKLRNKPLIVLICFALQLIPQPNYPCLPYNLDSAALYLVYYALGYSLLPAIRQVLAAHGAKGRWLLACGGALALAFSVFTYFGMVPPLPGSGLPFVGEALAVGRTMVLIWLWVCVAYLLRNVQFLAALGRDTLYDCGNEYIVSMVVTELLGILGVKRSFGSPLAVVLYCAAMLVVIHYTLAPMERRLVRFVCRAPEAIWRSADRSAGIAASDR